MSEHTKKQTTKIVILKGGSKTEYKNVNESTFNIILGLLKEGSYVLSDEFVAELKEELEGEEAYKGSAIAIKGYRTRENLSQNQLCRLINISQSRLSAIENARNPVGKKLAKRLSDVFNIDYKIFLSD